MYYLQIGENGEFHEIKNAHEAARLYARHGEFKTVTALPLGCNRWEIKSIDWRGNARFRFCCYGKSKVEAFQDFYKRVFEKLETDVNTMMLDEDQYTDKMLFA